MYNYSNIGRPSKAARREYQIINIERVTTARVVELRGGARDTAASPPKEHAPLIALVINEFAT